MLNPVTAGILAVGSAFIALTSGVKKSIPLIQTQNTELNNLVDNVISAAEGTDERTAAIERLQQKYPDFLSNLKDEEISNLNLRDALKETNAEFLKKLRLQSQSEKIQKLQNLKTEAGIKLIKLQEKAQEQVRKFGKGTINDEMTHY